MRAEGFPSIEARREGLELLQFKQVHRPGELNLASDLADTERGLQIRDDLGVRQVIGV